MRLPALLEAPYRQGNQSRHVLMIGLVVMEDTKGLLLDLGYASILEYAK